MAAVRTELSPFLECGIASAALPGERTSGDLHLVQAIPHGVLVAVADGLGHGEEAALAAGRAMDTLAEHAHESVISLVRRCHEACRGTRGVVMSVASFNVAEETMTWVGVGNVEGVLLRADARATPGHETIVLRGGVVGYELPLLRASTVIVSPGDMLIFATDGVRQGFALGLPVGETAQRLADQILTQYGKQTDDGLALVARYRK